MVINHRTIIGMKIMPQKSASFYDSSSTQNYALDELKQIYRYSDLIFQLTRRDILTRYKRSVLGVAWTMLNPLGTMLVLSIAFSGLFKTVEGYPSYILSGLIVWNFFSQTTTSCMVNLIWGGNLLTRIYIPRSSFALSSILTGIVNILFSLIPLLIILIATQRTIGLSIFLLPLPMLILALFSLGIGLLLSATAIYFPDVSEMYQIILTAWMYITPIFYPESIYPENIAWYLTHLNPMYYILKLFRAIIYEARVPNFEEIFPPLIIGLVICTSGWLFFTKKSNDFSYRI
jgi:ABC-2 type transport system permease protein